MSAQHTPGPWYVVTDNMGFKSIFSTEGGTATEDLVADIYGDNAHLIAAAPDLVEAAKLADAVLANAGFSPTDPDVLRIRAAIAKATGGTQCPT